jgi:hypothetical protein
MNLSGGNFLSDSRFAFDENGCRSASNELNLRAQSGIAVRIAWR